MPEPKDPVSNPGVDPVPDDAEVTTVPLRAVEVERTPNGAELASNIDTVFGTVSAHVVQLADQAVQLRDQLIARRLHGNKGQATEFDRIIKRECKQLGITDIDYELARSLATVPDSEVPENMLELKQRVRQQVIDPIDHKIAGLGDFRGYFPDPNKHEADIYDVSYRYAVARERLEAKGARARNGVTDLISAESYFEDAFDIELEKLAMLDEFSAMIVIRVDVSNFKLINDRYSHADGDRVLKELAVVFSNVFKRPFDITGSNGMAGQPGGDEFVFIVNGINLQANVDTEDLPELSAHRGESVTYKQTVIAALVKRLMDAAATVSRPDGKPIQLKVGISRIHQQEARDMLYSKGDKNKVSFQEYQRRADDAAKWAGELGDSEAAEWGPNMPEIELTPERALARMQKALSRTIGPAADDLQLAGRLMQDDPEVMDIAREDPMKAMALYFSKMETMRRASLKANKANVEDGS